VSAGRRLVFLALALLAGCAAAPPPAGLEGRIWDVRGGRFVGEDELLARLRAVRFRLLGEVHDHPAHHALRAALLAKLAPTDVFLEQFDREQEGALREAQAAGADADALARAGRMDEGWGWPLHRPVLQAALAARLPVRAANLSPADTRRIARAGALGPQDGALVEALARADWTGARDAALRAEILEGHCGMLPARIAPAMALAQRTRDAAIALTLASAGGNAVLIAGNGHVRRDLGVPLYLPKDASALSVGLLETRPDEADPRAYAGGVDGEAAYDFLWFTAPQPRPDPCEALRKR
jgi:uncharacterized iron-regulated protein